MAEYSYAITTYVSGPMFCLTWYDYEMTRQQCFELRHVQMLVAAADALILLWIMYTIMKCTDRTCKLVFKDW
jgi:hypothetical protein